MQTTYIWKGIFFKILIKKKPFVGEGSQNVGLKMSLKRKATTKNNQLKKMKLKNKKVLR